MDHPDPSNCINYCWPGGWSGWSVPHVLSPTFPIGKREVRGLCTRTLLSVWPVKTRRGIEHCTLLAATRHDIFCEPRSYSATNTLRTTRY